MATSPRISIAAAEAMANALTTTIDGGTAAFLNIYSGTQPTNPDTSIGAAVLLASLAMSATSFGAATNANPGALITANAISSATAGATGTASWFRIWTQIGGSGVFDGSVGVSAADLVLNTTAIVAGATVLVSSATITMPQS